LQTIPNQQTFGAISLPARANLDKQSVDFAADGRAIGVERLRHANVGLQRWCFQECANPQRVPSPRFMERGQAVRELTRGLSWTSPSPKGLSFYGTNSWLPTRVTASGRAAPVYTSGPRELQAAVPGFKRGSGAALSPGHAGGLSRTPHRRARVRPFSLGTRPNSGSIVGGAERRPDREDHALMPK